jgi:hypothetical protein
MITDDIPFYARGKSSVILGAALVERPNAMITNEGSNLGYARLSRKNISPKSNSGNVG